MFLKWRRRKTKLNDILQKATTPRAYSTYACVGVIATAVVAAICMHKYEKDKAERVEVLDADLSRADVIEEVKRTATTFVPVVAVAVGTMLCIKKADRKWMALNGMISTTCTLVTDRLNRYRSAMPGLAAAEVLHGFAKKPPDDEKQWFCIRGMTPGDELIYFQSTPEEVITAEYKLNRNFQIRGSASVREFFAFLGIQGEIMEKDEGDLYGWDIQTMFEDMGLEAAWIDFDERTYTDSNSGQQVTEISYLWDPVASVDGEPFAYEHQYAPYGLNPTE